MASNLKSRSNCFYCTNNKECKFYQKVSEGITDFYEKHKDKKYGIDWGREVGIDNMFIIAPDFDCPDYKGRLHLIFADRYFEVRRD